MSSTKRRLDRLATHLHAVGCTVCKSWDRTIVEYVPPGGTPLPLDRPERCLNCGRRAPDRTARVLIIAPDDGEVGIVGEKHGDR